MKSVLALALFFGALVPGAHGFGYFVETEAPTGEPTLSPTREQDFQVTSNLMFSGLSAADVETIAVQDMFKEAIAALLSGVNPEDVVIISITAAPTRRLNAGGAVKDRRLDDLLSWIVKYVITNVSPDQVEAVVGALTNITPEAIEAEFTQLAADCDGVTGGICDVLTDDFLDDFVVDTVADADEIESVEEELIYSDAPSPAPTPYPTVLPGNPSSAPVGTPTAAPVYSFSYTEPQWWTDLLA